MKVFVTGASGLLGSRLIRELSAAGHRVAGTARAPARGAPIVGLHEPHAWRLGEPLPAAWLAGVDALVHCAYSPGAADATLNERGTACAIAAGSDARVPRQVLVSSFSAVAGATSAYGRMKLALEAEARRHGATIVRPGLILGAGGLFARMVATVRRTPVVPLPAGGRRRVPVIGVGDTAACIRALVERGDERDTNLCYTHRPELRELLRAVARQLRLRRLWLPLPIRPLVLPVSLLQRCGLRLPVDAESLKAYAVNSEDQHESHLARFGLVEPELQTVVAAALAELAPTAPER